MGILADMIAGVFNGFSYPNEQMPAGGVVQIEYLDSGFVGNWKPWGTVIATGSSVSERMKSVRDSKPGRRVRAVNMQGQVIDILN